jgi:hypothetical protein
VERIFTGKEEGSFNDKGKQSVSQEGVLKAARKLMGRGVNWELEWEAENGPIEGDLGKRMVAEGGGRGGSDEGKEDIQERIHDVCVGF